MHFTNDYLSLILLVTFFSSLGHSCFVFRGQDRDDPKKIPNAQGWANLNLTIYLKNLTNIIVHYSIQYNLQLISTREN